MSRFFRFAAALLLISLAARADDASKSAKIAELISLTNADQMMKQAFEQMKTMQMAEVNKLQLPAESRQSAQEVQQKILTLVQERLSWDRLKPMMVKIYADTFTEEDLDGIINFYKSPAGKSLMQKMPLLMQRSMAMGQEAVGDLGPEIKKIIEEARKKPGQQ
jgi:uncharacterized protein